AVVVVVSGAVVVVVSATVVVVVSGGGGGLQVKTMRGWCTDCTAESDAANARRIAESNRQYAERMKELEGAGKEGAQ
ncbi:hypothetical protein LCGC14_2741310, partial [marine sediment metagenome]